MPRCCNYITTSFAAPRSLTQLFCEDINFIVSCWKNVIFESKQELGWGAEGGPPARDVCTMPGEWLWQTEECRSALLLWFASNMLMRQRGPFLVRLVATQVTYSWQQARGVLFRHIPHFQQFATTRKTTWEQSRPFFTWWMDDFCWVYFEPRILSAHIFGACMGILRHAVSVGGLPELSL